MTDKKVPSTPHLAMDSFLPTKLAGWAIYKDSDDTVFLELLINGSAVGQIRADLFRSDLQRVRSDGNFAFSLSPFGEYPWQPCIAVDANVELRDKATGHILASTVWNGTGQKEKAGVFDESGCAMRLNKGVFIIPLSERTEDWRQELLKTAQKVTTDSIEGRFKVCISYGTLLGAVREGSMIGHDDDIDLMLVSSANTMLSAVNEFHLFQNHLISKGYKVNELSNGQIHVSRGSEFPLDIFLAWIENGRLSLTFTVKAGVHESDVLPFEPITLHGCALPAPRNPEVLLEAIYGPYWKVPDPSFMWQRSKEVAEYFQPIHNHRRGANSEYWKKYYSERDSTSPPQLPSQFALFALSIRAQPDLIVDLGCGNGRDALFFAAQGINTIGLDYAPSAIAANTAAAQDRGLAQRAKFYQVDVSDLAQITQIGAMIRDSRGESSLCVYSRFFFHALDENTEGAALLLISHILQRTSDFAALEFRTAQDAQRLKVTPEHYRRYIDIKDFISKAKEIYGLTCKYQVEGTGYAVFRDDDAYVVRMILEKSQA